MKRLNNRHTNGFTLVEIAVSMVLITILVGAVATVVFAAFRGVEDIQFRKDITTDGHFAVVAFAREFGQLSNSGSFITGDDSKIKFSHNLGETVEYELTGGKLYRKVDNGSSHILANSVDVANSSFSYFKQDNSELTNVPLSSGDRANVWMVEFVLKLVNDDESILYVRDVFPENLKLSGS